MKAANIYLTFDGNCEEAFSYYKEIFNADYDVLMRFKEMPPEADFPIAEEQAEKIMHATLRLADGVIIMGSDTGGGPPLQVGNNFSIALDVDSNEEVDRLFEALSSGGETMMPPNNTFWGAYFGLCQDKFGINWMVSTGD